jgi:hypothetical protein
VRQATATFAVFLAVFDTGLSVPATTVGGFNAVVFLFTGAVGRTCAVAELVCRFGHDGMKRARTGAELSPAVAHAAAATAMGQIE